MTNATVTNAAMTPERNTNVVFAGAVLAGALVAVLAGAYGQVHDPASETTIKLFFTTTLLHFHTFTQIFLASIIIICNTGCRIIVSIAKMLIVI